MEKVTNIIDLRRDYIDIYKEARQFILSYKFVEWLSALETEIYTGFPDKSKLLIYINNMRSELYDCDKDEVSELLNKLNILERHIEDMDSTYMKLYTVKEIITNEN